MEIKWKCPCAKYTIFLLDGIIQICYDNVEVIEVQNIPVFTSEYGVASLILKEIPYSGIGYIRILSSLSAEALLMECMSFCRMAGAENIYATGHEVLKKYPIHSEVVQMQIRGKDLPDECAERIPVTEENLHSWQQIYNEKMSEVDNASYMTLRDCRKMMQDGQGWFIAKDKKTVAIAMAEPGRLHAVASVVPGGGRIALGALKSVLGKDLVLLDVASTNFRAIRLYETLGFQKTKVISVWYKII